MYTDCHKSYSTVSLPGLNSADDNSGAYTISVDINSSPYQIGDTATFDLLTSPHSVRYTVTDLSSNSAQCEVVVTVSSVDGKICYAAHVKMLKMDLVPWILFDDIERTWCIL